MSALLAELENVVASRAASARRNYFAAYVLYVIALASSIASTVVVALQIGHRGWQAVLTATPAIALLIGNTLRLEERNQWHRLKKYRLEALRRRLKFESADERSISQEWRDLDEKMAVEFPGFGTMPGAVKGTKNDRS